MSPHSGWVVDQAIAKALAAGAEYTLNLVLRATVAMVTLNGQVLASRSFNAAVTDGPTGVLGQGAVASFDRFRFRTDDDQFTGPATPQREVRISDATVVEGNSGSRTVTLSLTLSQAKSTPLTVSWTTLDGTATAGTDFLGVTSGTVTFAANSTTVTITLTVYGDTLYEPNEQFMVQLLAGSDFNLADGFGTVTMTNDDAAPVARKAGMTSTSTATAPTTTTSTTTTAAASSLLVAAPVTLAYLPLWRRKSRDH